ncbi:UNKNOWN [Stylonychia lemnae]|uniref:Uncharacterized protein n=1 Tax=Stylonychia lemnae TaxID=5949 RepID=A0A078B9N0_STYLE|nr:UNKNOWN [Stylonychia lemnae]|eukprot:CDW91144.1 UNKNOWN [Stylonychia lemnae]
MATKLHEYLKESNDQNQKVERHQNPTIQTNGSASTQANIEINNMDQSQSISTFTPIPYIINITTQNENTVSNSIQQQKRPKIKLKLPHKKYLDTELSRLNDSKEVYDQPTLALDQIEQQMLQQKLIKGNNIFNLKQVSQTPDNRNISSKLEKLFSDKNKIPSRNGKHVKAGIFFKSLKERKSSNASPNFDPQKFDYDQIIKNVLEFNSQFDQAEETKEEDPKVLIKSLKKYNKHINKIIQDQEEYENRQNILSMNPKHIPTAQFIVNTDGEQIDLQIKNNEVKIIQLQQEYKQLKTMTLKEVTTDNRLTLSNQIQILDMQIRSQTLMKNQLESSQKQINAQLHTSNQQKMKEQESQAFNIIQEIDFLKHQIDQVNESILKQNELSSRYTIQIQQAKEKLEESNKNLESVKLEFENHQITGLEQKILENKLRIQYGEVTSKKLSLGKVSEKRFKNLKTDIHIKKGVKARMKRLKEQFLKKLGESKNLPPIESHRAFVINTELSLIRHPKYQSNENSPRQTSDLRLDSFEQRLSYDLNQMYQTTNAKLNHQIQGSSGSQMKYKLNLDNIDVDIQQQNNEEEMYIQESSNSQGEQQQIQNNKMCINAAPQNKSRNLMTIQ